MQAETIQSSRQPMITDGMLSAMPLSPEYLRGLKAKTILRLAKQRLGRRFNRAPDAVAALLAMEGAA